MDLTIEVYRDGIGEYRWRAKAGNGEGVADSSEGYVHHEHATRMAVTLFTGPNTVNVIDTV